MPTEEWLVLDDNREMVLEEDDLPILEPADILASDEESDYEVNELQIRHLVRHVAPMCIVSCLEI